MKIVGLDVGRSGAVAAALEEFPSNPKRYFAQHRREFVCLRVDKAGVERLLSMAPDGLVMEPTGIWYASFWKELAAYCDIPIYWVGHSDLAAQRKSYGFVNKRDDEDAFCLALTFFDDRFIDVHDRKRYLTFETGTIAAIRNLFLELEQIDKCRNSQVNQLRQRLALEFPEISARRFHISNKLGFSPPIGWLAGLHTYSRIENEYRSSVARTIGIGISDYTRDHACAIANLELRIFKIEHQLAQLLRRREFAGYLKVFRQFGFGLRNQALLLSLIYPFDKFLLDGRPWVEWEEGKNGKMQKRRRSLRSFQAYLGLSYTLEQSGDKLSKKFGGSDLCRAHLYMWAVDQICVRPGARLNTEIGRTLGEKYDGLRKWNVLDGKRTAGTDAVPGRDAIIRILFKATQLLFKELCRELISS